MYLTFWLSNAVPVYAGLHVENMNRAKRIATNGEVSTGAQRDSLKEKSVQ